ncbi:hypothetical protein WA588_004964, partial [Blastocystis sp. NMH]
MSTGGFTFSAFGSGAKQQSTTTTGFGTSTWGGGNQTGFSAFGQQQNAQPAAPNPVSVLLQSYKYILESKNQEDDSVFSCVMFNYCPQDIRDDYLRDERNRTLYGKYLKENPDPDNLVPVYVYGFDGLNARIQSQKEVIKSVDKDLEVLQNAVNAIHLAVAECGRMALQCETKQRELEEKMIRVLGKMETSSSRPGVSDEAFIGTVVRLQREITLPTTGLRSRLSAIYSTLNTFGIHVPEHCLQLENVDSLLKFLENQEMALEKTVHILKQSQRELELIVSDPFIQ